MNISASAAMEKLKSGNLRYLNAKTNPGDVSPEIRHETFSHGQHPYAVVVTCSDSRVVPEDIFSAGIGELFVIRVAGNVIGDHELGSVEYATEHLGARLVLVLGHSGCGAVDAAMNGETSGFVKTLTDMIKEAIGDERDPVRASIKNADFGASLVRKKLKYSGEDDVLVCGGFYDTDTGRVEFR